jgi:predicted unusual protein kinase regulating ubiquinone biosynthesis (AarF/ABC1/UbiB family)
MDYEKEKLNLVKFKDFAKTEYIVPEVYPKFCTKKVLCMEYVEGQSIDTYLETATNEQKRKLALDFFTLFLKEIFQWRLLQSDAHPGNYLIKNHKWVLIDFGATKDIEDNLYEDLVHALFTRDKELMFKSLGAQGAMDMENTDLEYFWEYCKVISEPLQDNKYEWSTSDILNSVLSRSKELQSKIKFHRLPHENIFIDRKISGVYFMLKKIGAEINLNQLYREFKSSL